MENMKCTRTKTGANQPLALHGFGRRKGSPDRRGWRQGRAGDRITPRRRLINIINEGGIQRIINFFDESAI